MDGALTGREARRRRDGYVAAMVATRTENSSAEYGVSLDGLVAVPERGSGPGVLAFIARHPA